jgi:SeqA protein N-terminal domain
MKMIKVSEDVWQAIAERGKFGETEDDVLRRVFELPMGFSAEGVTTKKRELITTQNQVSFARRRSLASQRMTSYIARDQLHIEFQDGASSHWTLPNRKDKSGIRAILDKALSFAREHGASLGQINAARKTLTNEGYHLTK